MSEIKKYNQSSSDRKEIWKIINLLSLALIFIISYSLFWLQAQGYVASDTKGHIGIAVRFFNEKDYFIPHPLWHMGIHYLSGLLHIDLNASASIFTAALVALYAVLIYGVARTLDAHSDNEAKWYLITLISLTIGPFFIMSFNPCIYIGQGSPSVWHNVTILIVQPLTLLSVFYTIKFFLSDKFNYFIVAILVTMLSVIAKPSYIIVFLPSLVIYVLLKKYFAKRQLLFTATIVFSSVAILVYQFMKQFTGGSDDSVVVDILGVWSLYTPSVPVSILLALGLPLLITLFNYRYIKENEYIKFSWLLVFFSFVLFAGFAESGRHYSDGNFGWSWNISLSLIYIFTIIEYFKHYYDMPPLIRYSLLAMMLYQVYVGWYFLIGMFNGVNYLAKISQFPFF